jgi:hypothetical protein
MNSDLRRHTSHSVIGRGAALALFSACHSPASGQISRQPVTFNEHIAPILLEHCANCHRPAGLAPFSLRTYDEVRQRARRINRAVTTGFMPPWLPDSGYGRFEGERRLSGNDILLIGRWLNDGLLEGGNHPPPHNTGGTDDWLLGPPDLVVTIPRFELSPHTADVYRNLVVPIPVAETRYVRSVELIPGGTDVVHHARMMVDTTASSRTLDADDPGPGFDGMDLISKAANPDGFFVGWTPGKIPHENRQGLSWRVEPGTDLVLQVHLPASETLQVVEPRIGFRFAESRPTRHPALVMLGSFDIDIPPGDSSHTVTDTYELPVDVSVLGLYPHAHYLGKRIEGFAQLPDGEVEWLIRISDWDFNWQDEYHYVDPVDLPAGSILTMRVTYDNSADNPRNPNNPPKRVTYGSNSTDEMASLVVQVLPRHPGDLDRLQRDLNLWQYAAVVSDIARREHHLGLQLAAEGDIETAIAHFREALSNKFDEPEIHNDMGTALTLSGRLGEAAAHFRESARLAPDWAEPVANLVRVLLANTANQDWVRESLEASRRAAQLTDRRDPGVLELLARAYHANGHIDSAIATAQEALRLAEDQRLTDLASRIRGRLTAWR